MFLDLLFQFFLVHACGYVRRLFILWLAFLCYLIWNKSTLKSPAQCAIFAHVLQRFATRLRARIRLCVCSKIISRHINGTNYQCDVFSKFDMQNTRSVISTSLPLAAEGYQRNQLNDYLGEFPMDTASGVASRLIRSRSPNSPGWTWSSSGAASWGSRPRTRSPRPVRT